ALRLGQRRLPRRQQVARRIRRELVYGQEVDRGADVLLGERALVFVAGRAGAFRVDPDDVEVVGVRVARGAGGGVDPVELRDRLVVRGDVRLADRAVALELVELRERDRGEDVGEVRLVAGNGDVVERTVAAAHHAQVVDRARDGIVVRRDEAALAGGDVLR